MSFAELVVIARVTKAVKPKTVFEIGTYNGLTTAVFILNSEPSARIFSLDLPSVHAQTDNSIPMDKELVASRNLGAVPRTLGLREYVQLRCDSMQFDPSEYSDSIDIGLVDGAHDVLHAENDTIKMAKMMSDAGMIFWHDYGGKGALRALASYLEDIGKRCPVYRIPGTSLAWAPAVGVKKLLRDSI
jgi:hypothetical protein